ncbi:phosphoethanolamine--lipid A transferase EptA [Sphingobacterium sp. 2149]|uniref:phosphoethanolamine--lipid A transferase EptA n=1 Tax=Sphingobacterium sp. 2149 TaxID=2817763 RepID=UPI001AE648D9|nr:phosphoethanolamine--lipid A transferase EptA [Sphingobacterium sp. 2149]MDR6737901.1 lipid A ethanolaminephosphotransferase [Sphingobacterium sp. 2149]
MLKNSLKLVRFVLLMSVLNFIFFHFPFYTFVFNNVDYRSFGGIILIGSLMVLMLVMNAFVLYLFFSLSRRFGKSILVLFFLINSIAVYFVNTYSVILDETMIGNILNTRYSESSGFFSLRMILYLLVLGIIPSIFIIKANIVKDKPKKFLVTSSLSLLFIVILIFANATNWLWIDKNSKTLGALAMPWSYTVNISRFYIHEHQKNKKEILLPDATITSDKKTVVVLVIGESARRENFSLYGYQKNTNPLLSKTPNLHHFDATSCSTYTTAGVKCLLEHKNTDDLYEILPNYLYRNDVDVIWRTSNWGEPPVHIKEYETSDQLAANCKGEECAYDEVLLTGLKERISASKMDKVFVVLHTSTSHGPTYSKKYPAKFEVFKPVCNSVELGNCSKKELINAYDNTVVYTDYILHRLIEDLKGLKEYNSAMLFVSDHGESLGENNLYMHGLPMSIAPKEQYEIPFIVWVSDHSKQLKPNRTLTQNHVFHSVLKFLDMKSSIYDENMNIFK